MRYYDDDRPGITRRRQGRGFAYPNADGTRIVSAEERARIEAIAIPPAHENVWISPHADGHLLATGRDAKGRKQFIYHPEWRAAQDKDKFDHLSTVGEVVPRLRRWIASALSGQVEDRQTAIAAALALVERGSLRPGSARYTRSNSSYGATTLLPNHFERAGQVSVLTYQGKGGISIEKHLRGDRLADVLDAYRKRAAPFLITWSDEADAFKPVLPVYLNDRLAEFADAGISAKDVRTWNGILAAFRVARSAPKLTRKLMAETAAKVLHNTPAIAQKSYIHPAVLALAGSSLEQRQKRLVENDDWASHGYRSGEAALIGFLRRG